MDSETAARKAPEGFKRTTRERYWYALEVLPPAYMGYAGFLVGEPVRHNDQGRAMFDAFLQFGDEREGTARYYESNEPMTIPDFRALCDAMRYAARPGAPVYRCSAHSRCNGGLVGCCVDGQWMIPGCDA